MPPIIKISIKEWGILNKTLAQARGLFNREATQVAARLNRNASILVQSGYPASTPTQPLPYIARFGFLKPKKETF